MTSSEWPSGAALLQRLAAAHGIAWWAGSPPAARRIPRSDGASLSYLDWGGTGEPILLLHGGALTAHSWDLVSLALCHRFRCVALDLRGHGESAWASDYTIDAHVADVSTLVEALGWTKVHLVGMSLGGCIAGHYAASAASRAASLVLVDVGPNVDFGATGAMREFFSRPIADLSLHQLVETALQAGARGGYDKILYRYLHMTRIGPEGRLAWRYDREGRTEHGHVLDKLQDLGDLAVGLGCKVLAVRGARSRILTDEKVAAFAARCRFGRWLTIPEAGHNVQEDEPKALATVLDEFLGA